MNRAPDPNPLDIPFRAVGPLLRDYAAAHPTKTAIHDLDNGETIGFGALEEIVARSAARILDLGVGPGDKVVILSDECVEKLILFLAAWRVGAVACPFHAEIAPRHLRDIIHRIGPALVLWHAEIDGPALTDGLAAPTMRFGRWQSDDDGFFATLPTTGTPDDGAAAYGPEDVACIFATSGTTDRPKCVVWDHLGLWLCGLSTIDFTAMTADDQLLEYRTFSWLSPQIITMMPFLQLGLTIHVARRFSHGQFFDWIGDNDITVAVGVPTVINMLLSRPVDVTAADLPTLRLMTSSSAPLAPEQWRAFEARYDIPVLQFYGASEGGWLCGNRHDRRKVGTAGPPARHMDLAIVDADGAPCPSGVEGEITIRGPQTALATIAPEGDYEDRKPFRLSERARTGDLGVMDADGFVTVTGRVKDLIIRGGVNIAPLEIDGVLMQHPKVHEAAAFGIPDDIYGEEIACYVVPTAGETMAEDDIVAHCASHLPDFKTPKHVYFIDQLIKSDRGKVRRELLKEAWARDHAQ